VVMSVPLSSRDWPHAASPPSGGPARSPLRRRKACSRPLCP
jgi:hypothetical protein